MNDELSWFLPLTTVSEANRCEHWTVSSKRHKQQQFFVRQLFKKNNKEIILPCTVKMIRLSPRLLDKDDNLPMAFKWIKDEIADCLLPDERIFHINASGKIKQLKGRSDDSELINWLYGQEKSKIKGIRIEIAF